MLKTHVPLPESKASANLTASPCLSLTYVLLAGLGLVVAGLIVAAFWLDLVGLPVWVWSVGPIVVLLLIGAILYLYFRRKSPPSFAPDWAEAGLFGLIVAGVLAYTLWLGRPALLPVGTTVDAVHQFGLANYIYANGKLPIHALEQQANLQDGLQYPPAFVTLVALAAGLWQADVVYLLYPIAALCLALACATTYALAAALLQGRTGRLPLATLAAVLTLVPYGYTFGSITSQNYFAMVLAQWLLLLSLYFLLAWQRLPGLPAAALFGLSVAALLIAYPTWALVPVAAFILVVCCQRKLSWRMRITYFAGLLVPLMLTGYFFLKDRVQAGFGTVSNEGDVLLPDLSRYGWPTLFLAAFALGFGLLSYLQRRKLEISRLPQLVSLYTGLLAGEGLAFYLFKTGFGRGSYYSVYKLFYPAAFLFALLAVMGLSTIFEIVQRPMSDVQRLTRFKYAALVVASVVVFWLGLGLTWLAHPAPERSVPVITPDMVRAGRWLEQQNLTLDQYSVGYSLPPGTPAYWLQVGFLKLPQGNRAKLLLTGEPLTFEQWFYNAESEKYFFTDNLSRVNLDERSSLLYQSGSVGILTRTPSYKDERARRQSLTMRYRAELSADRLKLTAEASFSNEPSQWTRLRLTVEPAAGGPAVFEQTTPAEPNRERQEYMGIHFELPSLKPLEVYTNGLFPPVKYFAALVPGRYQVYLELQKREATVERRKLMAFSYAGGPSVSFDAAQRIQEGQFLFDGPLSLDSVLPTSRLDFGQDRPQLSGYALSSEARAGQTLPLTLSWFNPVSQSKNYRVRLNLFDSAGQSVAESESVPLNGLFPLWFWPTNQPVNYVQNLKLPDAPGRYTLGVSLLDTDTNQQSVVQKLDKLLEVS